MFRIQNRSCRRMALQGRPGWPGWRQGRSVLVGAALAATLASGSVAAAGEERALLERLKKLYPASEFTAVSKTPLAGMFEVTIGPHVAYVGKDGRYFVFGRLVDLQNQVDSKATPSAETARRIDINELPLHGAIVQVNGSGARKLFVFLDPKCPGCDQLDADLSQLPDTTVYTFLAPALNPEAREAARKQWIVFMPERALETQVIDENLRVAKRLGFTGMPTLIRGDGELVSGAMPLPMLSAWLAAGTKVAQAEPR